LACETEEGDFLGTVKNIVNLSSDVYTLEKDGKEILFPSVNGVIVKFDVENGKIVVNKEKFDQIAVK
jgi:ribosomal 30S subunit maturation factor RimM